jgi:CheY-like chemotaxis protein
MNESNHGENGRSNDDPNKKKDSGVENAPLNIETRSTLSQPSPPVTGKKRFEFFFEDKLLTNGQEDSGDGFAAFVGSIGQLDCSIGTIFQSDFQKTLSDQQLLLHDMDREGNYQNNSNALSVLIVDDSVIHRKLSQKVLGGMIDEVMWMVECAENGERAMQLVQTSPRRPDVIIIDQNMEPGGGRMLGHEVVELLRKDSAFDHVVIIGCTGMAETARNDLLLAGCDAVWSKPMPSREQAQAQIVQILRNKKNMSSFGGGGGGAGGGEEYDLSSYPGFMNQQVYERDGSSGTIGMNPRRALTGGVAGWQEEEETKNQSALSLLDSTMTAPVFRQVKMARISYKPIPSSSLLPFSRYGAPGAGGAAELLPPPNFNFGILPRAPPGMQQTRRIEEAEEEQRPDQNPLDITSMQRALANLSTFPTPIVHQFTS